MTNLDAAEYLQLALHAINNNDHHAALSYLKSSLEQNPDDAIANYLLGIEHAELGLYERAAQELQYSLELMPSLYIARFQLGLLQLQLGLAELAQHTFHLLIEKTDDVALNHFGQAFLAIIANQEASAIGQLQQGLLHCEHNLALKADMTRVLNNLQNTETMPPKTEVVEESAKSSSDAMAIFLGAYRDSIEKSE